MGRTSILFASLVVLVVISPPVSASAQGGGSSSADFQAFLTNLHTAHDEYINGRPAAFKALWSRRDDVTIFGGFGAGERGWEAVGPRLDWASSQFEKGTRTREVISTVVTADLGYVVQLERVQYTMPGTSTRAVLELRVTMIARREGGEWRLVHRHADSQLAKQPPR